MTLTDQVVKNVITRLIKSRDYRIEIVNLLNAEFLEFAVSFFKKITEAKLNSETISLDWYNSFFRNDNLCSGDIAINSGLNSKTIFNMYGTGRKSVVIDVSDEHFDLLTKSIQSLLEFESELDLTLTIKFKGVSVDLNINESMVVINTLAVKRAAFRGGLWSTTGKRVEKYLALVLCKLYSVEKENYNTAHFVKNKGKNVDREVDFYLISKKREYLCEVKLMGRGNPESADSIFARNSDVFIADTLSTQNKNQCNEKGVEWVSLREKEGFRKFKVILENLEIPHKEYKGNLDIDLPKILDDLMG
jgi:hypothetical protein